jgi:toxin CptA
MGHYSVKPLQVDLQPSPHLAVILLAASICAACMLLLVPVPWWIKLAGVSIIGVATVRQLRRHAWRSADYAWVRLQWSAENGWQAWRAHGEVVKITLLPDSMVHSALVVLRFRCEGQRWPEAIVLLADGAEHEALRRLRVQLRWAYERTSAEPAPR